MIETHPKLKGRALGRNTAHSHENGSSSGFFVLWSNNPCYLHKICNRVKGTNGRQKTYEIFHVYCVFYPGFMCQTTVILGITKDGSLVLTTLTS